jgi:hypothetical protein
MFPNTNYDLVVRGYWSVDRGLRLLYAGLEAGRQVCDWE